MPDCVVLPAAQGILDEVKTMMDVKAKAMFVVVVCLVACQTIALTQTLGTAPQFNKAVPGQTGAQPEGAFFNIINWVGNVIAPVGAVGAVVGGIVSYATGRGPLRWFAVAAGLLAVSGITRMIEFFITQGTGGVS
jgi:hypothetical protein